MPEAEAPVPCLAGDHFIADAGRRPAEERRVQQAQLRAVTVSGIRRTVRIPESPASASVTPGPAAGPVSVTTAPSAPGATDHRKSAGYSSAGANVASTDDSPRASSSGVTSGAPSPRRGQRRPPSGLRPHGS